MRYYELKIFDSTTGAVWYPTSDGRLVKGVPPNPTIQNGMSVVEVGRQAKYTFTSHPNGLLQPPDPGALNLEIDLPVSRFHTPQGGGTFRLHGVGLRMIGQSANLNGQSIVLSAGMGKGLPLANPKQAGVIYRGQIFQAWGNWRGTEQTLDFIVFPGDLTPSGGVMFNWQPGQALEDAIRASLTPAFPDYTPKINIAALQVPKGAAVYDTARSLMDFARMLNDITQPIGAKQYKDYPGVTITTDGTNIYVFDRTAPPRKRVALAFQDLIGQPTWLDQATITFQAVMRSDIDVTDYITFPSGIATPYVQLTQSAVGPNVPAQSKSVFQGTFAITEMQHFGNFREPDAASWNTTFRAAVVNPKALT